MSEPIPPLQPCPCASGRPFVACCGPLLAGQRKAASPRELMRSRFTAHVVHDLEYLHRTFQGTTAKPFRPRRGGEGPLNWTKLTIHGDWPGLVPEVGYVEFSAFYRDQRGEHELREKSEFRRVGGEWLYTRAVG